MDEEGPYLIFVNFGTPLFRPLKVSQKARKFTTKFSLLKSTLNLTKLIYIGKEGKCGMKIGHSDKKSFCKKTMRYSMKKKKEQNSSPRNDG